MDFDVLKRQPNDVLLRVYSQTLEELRRRGVVRSSNSPVADYAEKIAARALGLTLIGKSSAGHDAVDAAGQRYQIKGRRVTSHNASRQLSFIRNLDVRPFDSLVGVLFDAEFAVQRACVIPFEIVQARAGFSKHVHAHRLMLRDEVWSIAGVRDVTAEIARAAEKICAGAGHC